MRIAYRRDHVKFLTREFIGVKERFLGMQPVDISADGINLPVVRNEPERMRKFP